jgi:hypothetical protein
MKYYLELEKVDEHPARYVRIPLRYEPDGVRCECALYVRRDILVNIPPRQVYNLRSSLNESLKIAETCNDQILLAQCKKALMYLNSQGELGESHPLFILEAGLNEYLGVLATRLFYFKQLDQALHFQKYLREHKDISESDFVSRIPNIGERVSPFFDRPVDKVGSIVVFENLDIKVDREIDAILAGEPGVLGDALALRESSALREALGIEKQL